MLHRIFITLLTLLTFNAYSAPTPDALFSTINERLSFMEDVALFKANHGKAIEDIKREEVVIENASIAAEKVGLDKQSVVGFFQAQISAAKAIQYRYRADLLTSPETRTPRDLQTVVRPELIKLGKQINHELADFLKQGGKLTTQDNAKFSATIRSPYLTQADKQALFNALTQIQLQ
ncbi:chorismate mutase [Vibrio sp. NTOU-M3]|uniref:chorismate mutase n=1 Tax=Vibrio sp. NTOU-M3 TaxID=3234954 RepID=UPI00349FB382